VVKEREACFRPWLVFTCMGSMVGFLREIPFGLEVPRAPEQTAEGQVQRKKA